MVGRYSPPSPPGRGRGLALRREEPIRSTDRRRDMYVIWTNYLIGSWQPSFFDSPMDPASAGSDCPSCTLRVRSYSYRYVLCCSRLALVLPIIVHRFPRGAFFIEPAPSPCSPYSVQPVVKPASPFNVPRKFLRATLSSRLTKLS